MVMACAAMLTAGFKPCRRAKASEHRMAAAAPQVGGQHCKRVKGSKIMGASITSASVTVWRKTA
ncbi:hypothetical protein D3C86_846240 [compost metagenome]